MDKVSSLESEQIYYVSNSHDSQTELNINNNVDNEVNITQEKIEFDEQINEIELEKLDKQEPYINGCILNRNASFVVRIMEKVCKFCNLFEDISFRYIYFNFRTQNFMCPTMHTCTTTKKTTLFT